MSESHCVSLRIAAKTVLASLTLSLAAGALAQDSISRAQKNQAIMINYGKVIAVDSVKVDSNSGSGALLGGMVGLASGHGKSDKDKAGRAAAGALLGALLVKAAEGSRKAQSFTVQLNNGSSMKVIQDLADIRLGDCVSVEQGLTANIRGVSSEMCVQGPHLQDKEIQASHADDADECVQAKQSVLSASTDAEFARAERKVQILCY